MNNIETKKDLLDYLTKMVVEYTPKCKDSVYRNRHMNELSSSEENEPISLKSQKIIEAILVDFVNYIGTDQGLDWGLITKNLK